VKTIAPYADIDADNGLDPDAFKPLTAEQAQPLREQNPSLSPWWVVAGQVVMGLVAALAAWALTGKHNVVGRPVMAHWPSIACGRVCAGTDRAFCLAESRTAVQGFSCGKWSSWSLTVAMLIAAPRLVVALSWPALLVGPGAAP
jgi:ATP synthase protein I